MSNIATDPDAAPGTGETPPEPTITSPAVAQNTDGDGGTTETVPYSRFKEVNDAYRPFKELSDGGYDADSLRRLADWEAAFSAAPVESWLSLAERIEGMPEAVKDAIRQAQAAPPTSGATQPPPGSDASPEPESNEPPEWAKPLVNDYHQRVQQGETQAREEVLNGILSRWDELDRKDGLLDEEGKPLISANLRLSFIAGAAGSGSSADDILETARKEALEMLELGRRSVSRPGGTGPAPRPVPGTAAGVTPAPPVRIRSLEEATKAAKADLAAGRLQV